MAAPRLVVHTQAAASSTTISLQPSHGNRSKHVSGFVEEDSESEEDQESVGDGKSETEEEEEEDEASEDDVDSVNQESVSDGDSEIDEVDGEALEGDIDTFEKSLHATATTTTASAHDLVSHLIERVIPDTAPTNRGGIIQMNAAAVDVVNSLGNSYNRVQVAGSARLHAGDVYTTIHQHFYLDSPGGSDIVDAKIHAAVRKEFISTMRSLAEPQLPQQIRIQMVVLEDAFGGISYIDTRIVTDWDSYNFIAERALRNGPHYQILDTARSHHFPKSQSIIIASESNKPVPAFNSVFRPGQHVRQLLDLYVVGSWNFGREVTEVHKATPTISLSAELGTWMTAPTGIDSRFDSGEDRSPPQVLPNESTLAINHRREPQRSVGAHGSKALSPRVTRDESDRKILLEGLVAHLKEDLLASLDCKVMNNSSGVMKVGTMISEIFKLMGQWVLFFQECL